MRDILNNITSTTDLKKLNYKEINVRFVDLNLKGNEYEFFRNDFIICYCNLGYSYLELSRKV